MRCLDSINRDINTRKTAIKLIQEGYSVEQAAIECNTAEYLILQWAKNSRTPINGKVPETSEIAQKRAEEVAALDQNKADNKVAQWRNIENKRRAVADRYYDNGESAKTLATEYGVGLSTIHSWINFYRNGRKRTRKIVN